MGWDDDLLNKKKPKGLSDQEKREMDEVKRQAHMQLVKDKFQELKKETQTFGERYFAQNHVELGFYSTLMYEFGFKKKNEPSFKCWCDLEKMAIYLESKAGAYCVVVDWQQEVFVHQGPAGYKWHQAVDFDELMKLVIGPLL